MQQHTKMMRRFLSTQETRTVQLLKFDIIQAVTRSTPDVYAADTLLMESWFWFYIFKFFKISGTFQCGIHKHLLYLICKLSTPWNINLLKMGQLCSHNLVSFYLLCLSTITLQCSKIVSFFQFLNVFTFPINCNSAHIIWSY